MRCVEGDLESAAVAFAERLVRGGARAAGAPAPSSRQPAEPGVFEEFTRTLGKKQRGQLAPLEAVQAVRMAYELPFAEGLRREHERCLALLHGAQSRALRHAFAAEREVAEIPGLAPDTPAREIGAAAVVGPGTMGRGIAMCFANAGIPVHLLARTAQDAAQARAAIESFYAAAVARGSVTSAEAEQRLGLIRAAAGEADLAAADVVVEAISEDLAAKQQLFARLGARLSRRRRSSPATPRSSIYAACAGQRPRRQVAGMHFFNPGTRHAPAGDRAHRRHRARSPRHSPETRPASGQGAGAGGRRRGVRRQPHAVAALARGAVHAGGGRRA